MDGDENSSPNQILVGINNSTASITLPTSTQYIYGGQLSGSTEWNTVVSTPTQNYGVAPADSTGKRPSSVRGEISASLYFKYVKRNFSTAQRKALDVRLAKLTGIHIQCKETGQQALLEEVEAALVTTAKEQILLEKGFNRSLDRAAVEKFLSRSKDVKFKPLENFPRPIPENVRKILARAKALCIFDAFEVLFTDYTAPVKTTAQKIKEKDPIIFGIIKFNPGRLYFVADWIDEHCDLTLSKLVEQNIEVDVTLPLYKPEQLVEIEKKIEKRVSLLKGTNISNWRDREVEARAAERPVTPPPSPTPTPPPNPVGESKPVAEEPVKKKGFFAWLKSLGQSSDTGTQ